MPALNYPDSFNSVKAIMAIFDIINAAFVSALGYLLFILIIALCKKIYQFFGVR